MTKSTLNDVPADAPFMRSCRGESALVTPVWFMRQAGRSLPEYRAARAGIAMLDACRRPDLICDITLQPVRRYGVDAAILFSDIVLPLAAAGVDLDIVPGVGPVIAHPVRTAADIAALPRLAPENVTAVSTAVGLLLPELGSVPLIGFAGAPFTLASYLIEGGPSRTHTRTKALMYGAPDLWHGLCARLAEMAVVFLRAQIEAGAAAVQLFDSWVGALAEDDYRRYVLPHSAAIFQAISDTGVPRIHFGVGTTHLLGALADAGADVLGVDWRLPLDRAAGLVGDRPLQGNLDPALLFAPWEVIEDAVVRVLRQGRAAPGHIFNLGHGVPPDADPEVLARIVDLVHTHARS